MSDAATDLELASIPETRSALEAVGYLADEDTATSIHVAVGLGRPLLIEGPAGTGKTELARAVARASGADLVRLQCYEGLDESKVLYEWNYRKQLLWLQGSDTTGRSLDDLEDIFSEPFLLTRPVLEALRSDRPTVLLIDEIDRIEMETEALLLEVLSDFTVTIPELGTIAAERRPIVILTSNATRELSEALRRRCLYLWLDYPDPERERAILRAHVDGIDERLAEQVVHLVHTLRGLDLKKAPSIAESLDWAATLVRLGIPEADAATLERTIGTLLKHRADIERVRREMLAGDDR